jgi:hypothetical protein
MTEEEQKAKEKAELHIALVETTMADAEEDYKFDPFDDGSSSTLALLA